MNKKSFKIIGLVSLVASTVLLVACQSDTKNESSKSKDVQWGYTGARIQTHRSKSAYSASFSSALTCTETSPLPSCPHCHPCRKQIPCKFLSARLSRGADPTISLWYCNIFWENVYLKLTGIYPGTYHDAAFSSLKKIKSAL